MQFKTPAANDAYREIVQHVGKCVSELESEAFKQTDPGARAGILLQAKRMSIDGLSTAITTAYQCEIQGVGMVAHFAGQNGG